MRQDDVDEYLEQKPFQPFRIHLSTGAFFDIQQSQLAYTSRSTLELGLPLVGDKQRFLTIALVHIVWIEVLVPTP